MGVGPVALEVSFDYSKLTAADQTKLIEGSFKVVLNGMAQTTFAGKSAEADLSATFTFDARE